MSDEEKKAIDNIQRNNGHWQNCVQSNSIESLKKIAIFMYDYRIESMEFMCTKLESFPIIKAHMSHSRTHTHISKIQFQNEMISVSSVQSQNAFVSQIFFLKYLPDFLLKIEQITCHS